MEVPATRKTEETQTIEVQEEHIKSAAEVAEDFGHEVELVGEVAVDASSLSLTLTSGGVDSEEKSGTTEQSLQVDDDSVILDGIKEVVDSIIDSTQLPVPFTEEIPAGPVLEASAKELKDSSDHVTQVEAKKDVEKAFPSSNGTNHDAFALVTDVFNPNAAMETTLAPVLLSGGLSEGHVSGMALNTADAETTLPSSIVGKDGFVPVARDTNPERIEEKDKPYLDQSTGEPSGGLADNISAESTNKSLKPLSNTADVGSSDVFAEKAGPVVSLNRRPEQPTSWRSCCGLFEVLRRRHA